MIGVAGKATLQQLDNEPRLGLAAEAGMAILHLFLMLVGFLHISYIASLGMQPATGQSQEQAQQCVGSSSGSSRLSKSKESVAKARELLGHHEPVLHDQALADAIVTSTPNVKSLLGILITLHVLSTLYALLGFAWPHPVRVAVRCARAFLLYRCLTKVRAWPWFWQSAWLCFQVDKHDRC